MTTSAPQIVPRLMPDGRTAYTVGYVTVYDPQEAAELLQDGDFPIRCPLTLQALQPQTWYETRVLVDSISGERRAVAGVVVDGEWNQI